MPVDMPSIKPIVMVIICLSLYGHNMLTIMPDVMPSFMPMVIVIRCLSYYYKCCRNMHIVNTHCYAKYCAYGHCHNMLIIMQIVMHIVSICL